MRIALIDGSEGGHPDRSSALRSELERRRHEVAVLSVTADDVATAERARFSLSSRLTRRLTGAPSLPHAWDVLARGFRRRLAALAPELVLARGAVAAFVAIQPATTRLIVELDRVATLELANGWFVDALDLAATHQRETAVLERASVVAVTHRDGGQLLCESFPGVRGLATRLIEAPDGISPRDGLPVNRDAAIVCPSRLVHVDDPLLLAALVARLTRTVRSFGPPGPAYSFLPAPPEPLGVGEAASIGLVTGLSDRLSRLRSQRPGQWIERGIPILAPHWLAIDGALEPAVARYSEATFEADVEAAFEPDRFARLKAQVQRLRTLRSWSSTLSILVDSIEAC